MSFVTFKPPILTGLAKLWKKPYLSRYGNYDENIELSLKIPKNKILLGFENQDLTGEPVYLPYTGNQFNFIITGSRGSGKSVILMNIANQLINRFHHPIFAIDPKGEMQTHTVQNQNDSERQILKKCGIMPKGINMLNATPSAICEDDEMDNTNEYVFSLDIADFKRIRSPAVRTKVFMEYLNLSIDEDPASHRFLVENNYRLPDSTQKLLAFFNQAFGDKCEKMKLYKQLYSYYVGKNLGEGNKFYPPELMYTHNSEGKRVPKMVSLHLRDDEYDFTSACILKLMLLLIINDRKKAKKGKASANLHYPPVLIFDEADLYAGKGREQHISSDLCALLMTKHRNIDLYVGLATQKPHFLNPKLIGETDYIITSKFTSLQEKEAFRARNISDEQINSIFYDLKSGGRDFYPKEWALLNKENEVVTFYPIPTTSQNWKEQRTIVA